MGWEWKYTSSTRDPEFPNYWPISSLRTSGNAVDTRKIEITTNLSRPRDPLDRAEIASVILEIPGIVRCWLGTRGLYATVVIEKKYIHSDERIVEAVFSALGKMLLPR